MMKSENIFAFFVSLVARASLTQFPNKPCDLNQQKRMRTNEISMDKNKCGLDLVQYSLIKTATLLNRLVQSLDKNSKQRQWC